MRRALLAAAAVVLSSTVAAAQDGAGGLSGLRVRGIDIMKWTKDTLRSQPSDRTLDKLVECLDANLNLTHIAISVPLDPDAEYPDPRPGPRTAEEFVRKVCDTIHARGLGILHRGTWLGIEGLYGHRKEAGASRRPAGTAAEVLAGRDRETWLGRTHRYILDHPKLFADGDIWAPLPERTEGIFSDADSFLPHGPPGIQENYATFFVDLAAVSKSAFREIGREVTVGYTAQNFSEVVNGWLPHRMFEAAGIVCFDHYGITHTPEELDADLRRAWEVHGRLPIFHQEWGDYWNAGMDAGERLEYLRSIYDVLGRLADEGKLVGFNYWGGWTGDGEGVIVSAGTADDPRFELNARGRLLAEYFAAAATEPGREEAAEAADAGGAEAPVVRQVEATAPSEPPPGADAPVTAARGAPRDSSSDARDGVGVPTWLIAAGVAAAAGVALLVVLGCSRRRAPRRAPRR